MRASDCGQMLLIALVPRRGPRRDKVKDARCKDYSALTRFAAGSRSYEPIALLYAALMLRLPGSPCETISCRGAALAETRCKMQDARITALRASVCSQMLLIGYFGWLVNWLSAPARCCSV